MQTPDKTTLQKCVQINADPGLYGTFAEIGAGQEVARHFFVAGRASQTVAKTMSAYDMTFSDDIYGREDSGRYVVESRLHKMLDHEMQLLQERLGPDRGDKTRFFVFADTVATSRQSNKSRCHGWMGVAFQTRPNGPVNRLILHVRMLDAFRLQQQEALGIVGVNAIHSALFLTDNKCSNADFIESLVHNLKDGRVQVDMIHLSGEDMGHWDNRVLPLELLSRDLTEGVLFSETNKMILPSECLFRKPVLVLRGSFRPFTNKNLEIIQAACEQISKKINQTPVVLLEITMAHLIEKNDGDVDFQDFLARIESLEPLGFYKLITHFPLFHQVKTYLREQTNEQISMVMGAGLLDKLYEPEFYKDLGGGIMEAFGQLFDEKANLLVYPFKTADLCLTAKSYFPQDHLSHLHQFLVRNNNIIDIANCDDIDTDVRSQDVRQLLVDGNPEWEKLVPDSVRDVIKSKGLFTKGV